MSNPGVIKLAETSILNQSFRIEDNIGEAIHFHVGNMRMDFTIKTFYSFCQQLRMIVNSYFNNAPGFDIKYFDPLFFMQCAGGLSALDRIEFSELNLLDLYVDTIDVDQATGERNVIHKPLNYSRVFKCLNGDTVENDMRDQVNLIDMTNSERAFSMLEKIKKYGYPFEDKYIALVGKSNCICDGQHRAACLLYLYGNIKVKVMRLFFKDGGNGLDLSYLKREKLTSFIERHKHIYVYGAGDYGTIIYKKLAECNKEPDAFVVTNKKGVDIFFGKQVIKAETISYPPETCGFIFGLNQMWHDEVKDCLSHLGFEDYYIYENWEIEEMRKLQASAKNE